MSRLLHYVLDGPECMSAWVNNVDVLMNDHKRLSGIESGAEVNFEEVLKELLQAEKLAIQQGAGSLSNYLSQIGALHNFFRDLYGYLTEILFKFSIDSVGLIATIQEQLEHDYTYENLIGDEELKRRFQNELDKIGPSIFTMVTMTARIIRDDLAQTLSSHDYTVTQKIEPLAGNYKVNFDEAARDLANTMAQQGLERAGLSRCRNSLMSRRRQCSASAVMAHHIDRRSIVDLGSCAENLSSATAVSRGSMPGLSVKEKWSLLSPRKKWVFAGVLTIAILGAIAAAVFAPGSTLFTIPAIGVVSAKLFGILLGSVVVASTVGVAAYSMKNVKDVTVFGGSGHDGKRPVSSVIVMDRLSTFLTS